MIWPLFVAIRAALLKKTYALWNPAKRLSSPTGYFSKKYLPRVEQMKWELFEIMECHDMLLAGSLKAWSTAVLKDFGEKLPFPDVRAEDISDEIASYLKEKIGRFVLNHTDI